MGQALEALGITAVIGIPAVGALTYIARVIISHIFSRDLAAHKANLDHEMQRHTHTLNCLLQQFQIQYSKTFQHQVTLVRQLYDIVREIRKEIGMVKAKIQIPKLFEQSAEPKVIEEAIRSVNRVREQLVHLKDDEDIYLPVALSERLDSYLKSTDIPVRTPFWRRGSMTQEQVEEWERLWAEREEETDRIAAELKTEFRRLQGIDTLGQQDAWTATNQPRGRG